MPARLPLFRSALLPALLCAAACATPNARIRANQEKFRAYSLSDQEKIRAGKVEPGFTEEMVRIALGPPDRVYRQTRADGEALVWAYTRTDSESGTAYSYPSSVQPAGSAVGSISIDQYYEYLRVTFENGKVSMVERREK